MSYAIIRNAKYKRENLKAVYRHNERKNKNYLNNDIDKTKSYLNYSLKESELSYDKGIYYLNVETDNGNYINYSVSDFEIQNFLHKGMRNIFSRGTSDRMIQNYEDKTSQKNKGTYKQFSNDNYP